MTNRKATNEPENFAIAFFIGALLAWAIYVYIRS